MAIINAADYDHIDVVNGADANRHMLKDAQARAAVDELKSALEAINDSVSIPDEYPSALTSVSGGANFISNRTIPKGKLIEQVKFKSNSVKNAKIYVIRVSDSVVTHVFDVETVADWNIVPINVCVDADSYLGFYNTGAVVTSTATASQAKYSMSSDGLYEGTPKVLGVGSTVTISKTSDRYFIFNIYWTVSDGKLADIVNSIETIITKTENNNVALFAKKLQTGTNLIYGQSTILTNCDNVTSNVAYRLNYAVDATTIPQNTPYGSTWKSTSVAYFQSNVQTEGVHTSGDQQLFIGSDGVYSRYYGTSWTIWAKVADRTPENTVIVVDKNGNGDFTSLCAAILYAYANHENATVYVKQGTYDAIAEMKAKYGESYFDNMTSSAAGMIYLQNGIHIICEPGTVMTCYYEGSNENVNIYFAPINFRRGRATIENLTIKAKNVRYCIHDDQWSSPVPYWHILKNCRLEIDNTENPNWDRRLAYGGGLGVHGYVEFDNCYFKTEGLDGTAFSGYGACAFHNSPSEGAINRVVLNNCYFADNSTFRMTYYGQSQLISEAFVSGCSLGRPMETGPEAAPSLAPYENVAIIDCNNVIRS